MSARTSGGIARPAMSPLSRVEGQYRSALAQRWLALVLRSALFSTGTITSLLFMGCSFRSFLLSSVAALAAYPLAVYPILSARRAILICPTALAGRTSVFGLGFSSLTSVQGVRYLSANLISGLILASVYALVVNFSQPGTELGLLAATPRHPIHLNERFIFLLFGNAGVMLLLGAWDILARRVRMSWPTRHIPLASAVQAGLLEAVPVFGQRNNSLVISLISCAAYYLSYFALRKRAWVFLLTHSFGILRPFIVNFTKPSRSLSGFVFPHLLLLNVMSVMATRVPPIQAITPYLTTPLKFDALRRRTPFTPDQHLLIALQSRELYYSHFTLMELLRVSQNQARRKAIFDAPATGTPMILAIWEELLLHLGRAHQTLISRGGMRTAATPSSSARPATVKDSHTVQVRQANIFRPAAPTTSQKTTLPILSAFQSALDGPIQAAPPAIVGKAQVFASDAAQRVEHKALEWKGKALEQVEKTQAGGQVVSQARDVSRGFWASVARWVGAEWAERNVRASLPEVVQTERILNILATLACASLEEDTYGYVQKVLPGTMEIIVRHRSALLALRSELLAGAGALGPGAETAQQDIQRRIAVPLEACDDSLRRIADAFGESLKAFRFPSAIGSALAEICQVRAESMPS